MKRTKVLVGIVIVAAVVAFFALGGFSWASGDGNVEALLTETGVVGPLIFVAVMWLTQPLGVPGVVYMVPAGIVWPYPQAIALAWLGNMGASLIAFLVVRWFSQDWVAERIPTRMAAYYDRLEYGGLWPVVLLRLVFGQLAPADWLLAVTKVPVRTFLIGTAIGIVPGVVVFVVAGGGMFEALSDLSPVARNIAAVVLAIALVARRVFVRRRPIT